MSFTPRVIILVVAAWTGLAVAARADEAAAVYNGPACAGLAADEFFTNEVWAKVGAQTCLECHRAGGDAEESEFVLQDPRRSLGPAQDEAMRHNRDQFARVARQKANDKPRLLLKVVGRLRHGGKDVLKPDSPGYRILAELVERANAPAAGVAATPHTMPAADEGPPFFDGVVMLDDRRLLRRVTLSLAGRLPTDAELAAVSEKGREAVPAVLDAVMKEEAFYARLREGFNDVFLTVGFDGNAETVLSYDHFEKSRLWAHEFDLSHVPEKDREKARYKLWDDYRAAIKGEPMKLVEHIVRNDRPFTEIVTADYVMVTPYSARGYGVFEELKPTFKNPQDPFEYAPVKLKALVGRNPSENQESVTGYYPHAGLLSTFQYLRRYPTTETNRNRLRARMYYQHFLGVDVLELAARVTDAAAATAAHPIPTMQAPECVVCHKTLDPVAGMFQDYWDFEETYGRRKGGWFTDMFGAGYEGEDLPADQRWRALQWLGERTAKDPRFAVAMVEHVYYILTGRKVLQPPKDLEDPLYAARRRAYAEQRRQVEAIAVRFAGAGFNLKGVFKDWVASDFYCADGLASAAADPKRRAELDDVGVARMLSPEQVERKVAAVFGEPWGQLDDQLAMLYGGIDSMEVTERAADPSGAMGAIQRILANDVTLKHTARDFSRPPADRRLFPKIEPDVVPGTSPEADEKVRRAIVHLHRLLLGRDDAPDSPEVGRTFELFAGVVADAAARGNIEPQEIWSGRQNLLKPVPDPKYTVRAWRAVLTYLLRRPEFLYE